MTLTMADAPWLIKALLSLCVVSFIGGFVCASIGMVITLSRIKLFGLPEDSKLSFFERWYRRNSRTGELYLDARLRIARRMVLIGFLACFGSMASVAVLVNLFGRQV